MAAEKILLVNADTSVVRPSIIAVNNLRNHSVTTLLFKVKF